MLQMFNPLCGWKSGKRPVHDFIRWTESKSEVIDKYKIHYKGFALFNQKYKKKYLQCKTEDHLL